MINTLLIDGNNLVYRCASVVKLDNGPSEADGMLTSGIFGSIKAIPNYITELGDLTGHPVNEVIVVFDGGRSKRRTTLYPEYKGGRKTDADRTPEEQKFYHDFLENTNILNEELHLFGVKTIRIKGWEADDIIYGLIQRAEVEREDVETHFTIISTDEDFLQLVDKNVSVYSPIKKIYYDYDNFEGLFGCKPEHFIGYKILKGDSSDNIQGINGIGDKTGKKLMMEYDGLLGVLNPANRPNLMKSKVTQRIFTREGMELIDRNNQLINIKEFVDYSEVDETLSDVLFDSPSVDEKGARAFLMKYKFSSIIMKFKEWIKPYKNMVEEYYSE